MPAGARTSFVEVLSENRFRSILLGLAIATLIVSLRSIEVPLSKVHQLNDFAHYYITSTLIRQGKNPYNAPISGLYEGFDLINDVQIERATNPPALALLFVPFTFLSPLLGFWLWTALQLVGIVLGITWGVRVVGLELTRATRFSLVIAMFCKHVF